MLVTMYVCCCFAVTDDRVRAAIADGAHTREEVTRSCRAGGDCGACHGCIEDLIEEHFEVAADGTAAAPAHTRLPVIAATALRPGSSPASAVSGGRAAEAAA